MYCPHCGASAPDTAKFCTRCGRPLAAPQAAPSVPPTPPEQPQPPKKRPPLRALVAVLAVLMAALGVVIAVLLIRGNGARSYDDCMALAARYLEELDFEQAEAMYLEAIQLDPSQVEAYRALAELYIEQERFEDALDILARGIAATGSGELQQMYDALTARLTPEEDGPAEDEEEPEEDGPAEDEEEPEEDGPAEDKEDPEDTTGDAGAMVSTGFTTITEGVLIMSTNATFPPYEMTTDDGSLEGIDVEIAAAIAEKLGLELEILDMGFSDALTAVQEGQSDIAMTGIAVTEERLLYMDFSNSYTTNVQSVIVPEGSRVTIDALGNYTIGTQRATTGNFYCTEDFGEDHVFAYDSGIDAVQALRNGLVDCVVIDNVLARELAAANPGLTILDTEYIREEYSVAVDKGNIELLDAINAAIAELIADGSIQAIVDKYIY